MCSGRAFCAYLSVFAMKESVQLKRGGMAGAQNRVEELVGGQNVQLWSICSESTINRLRCLGGELSKCCSAAGECCFVATKVGLLLNSSQHTSPNIYTCDGV